MSRHSRGFFGFSIVTTSLHHLLSSVSDVLLHHKHPLRIDIASKGHRREYCSWRGPVESSALVDRYHGKISFSAIKVGKFDDP
jgi:hypothetical protein